MKTDPNALIYKHHNWRHLLRDLTAKPGLKRLSSMVSERAKFTIGPAVSLAWWLAHHRSDLLQKGALHIVIGGAEHMDVIDRGMWYSLVPLLLGMPDFKITLDLVGPQYNHLKSMEDESFLSNLRIDTELSGLLPNHATAYQVTLSEYLAAHDPENVDVLVLYQPGFDEYYDEWLSDDALGLFVNAGVPVLCSSYQESEYVMDRMILEAYGFSGISHPIDNPFKIDCDNDAVQPYHTLWQINGPVKLPVSLRDQDMFIRTRAINNYGVLSYREGDFSAIENLLHRETAKSESGLGVVRMINLPFNFWIKEGSGQVYIFDEIGLNEHHDVQITQEELARCPGPKDPLYDRVKWASEIMLKYELTLLEMEHDPQSSRIMTLESILGDDMDDMREDPDSMREFLVNMLNQSNVPTEHQDQHVEQLMRSMGMGELPDVPKSHKPIIDAIKICDDESIRRFIEQDVSLINAQNERGVTPLYYAAVSNNPELTSYLAAKGADPNHVDIEGWPIITETIRYGALDSLKVLLKAPGLDINKTNYFGWNAIMVALSTGHFECAVLLKEAGADMDHKNSVGVNARQHLESLRSEMTATQYSALSM